jgi:predicted SprT family Zn-dependent metalloprotease
VTKDGGGRVVASKNEISIDRQSVKDETVILHEIAHYATSISQTKPFEPHGVEFAKTHLFVVEKAAGSKLATKLKTAYQKGGIKVGN